MRRGFRVAFSTSAGVLSATLLNSGFDQMMRVALADLSASQTSPLPP